MAIGDFHTREINTTVTQYRPTVGTKELIINTEGDNALVTNGSDEFPIGGYYYDSKVLITNDWYLKLGTGTDKVEVTTLEVQ